MTFLHESLKITFIQQELVRSVSSGPNQHPFLEHSFIKSFRSSNLAQLRVKASKDYQNQSSKQGPSQGLSWYCQQCLHTLLGSGRFVLHDYGDYGYTMLSKRLLLSLFQFQNSATQQNFSKNFSKKFSKEKYQYIVLFEALLDVLIIICSYRKPKQSYSTS